MSGHVFITCANLEKLACDAWLLPTNRNKVVMPYWENQYLKELGVVGGDGAGFDIPDDFGDANRTARPTHWPDESERPMPILTITGPDEPKGVDWYLEAVTAFVKSYQETNTRYLTYRVRPLLGIPLVGSGAGGAASQIASLINHLIDLCENLVKEHQLDLAIVVKDSFHYSVCQKERRQRDKASNLWPALSPQQKESGRKIAEHAHKGELVVFLGAGISAGAGLPSWGQLIQRLVEKAELSDEQHKAMQQFNFLDQAEILNKQLSKAGLNMNREIVEILTREKIYSLAHTLISDWPVDETVTQNYDNMFEMACRDNNKPLSVIPYSYEEGTGKWILKMHGCVTKPDDIVLSRSDYLDYDYSRSALSGIVQALLVTKHMLFLGFSLTDDHFIQLIFGVQKAVADMKGSNDQRKFGSVLTPVRSAMQEELWSQDLNFVHSDYEGDHFLQALNWHDVFLDYVTCMVHTSQHYVFRKEYDELLSDDDLMLRDGLEELYQKTQGNSDSSLKRHFESYLKSLGKDLPS